MLLLHSNELEARNQKSPIVLFGVKALGFRGIGTAQAVNYSPSPLFVWVGLKSGYLLD